MQQTVTLTNEPAGSVAIPRSETGAAIIVPPKTDLSDSQRYHAMDALRASMMLLGVLFHASLPYMTFRKMSWFFDPASQNFGFDLFALFTHNFRMPVFFMAAGFFAALLYEKRGLLAMAGNRFLRIVIPFALGWLILSPLCLGAMKFGEHVAETGSLAASWEWLQAGGWVHWRGIFHLWFLAALMVLYPAGLIVRWLVLRLRAPHLALLSAGARRFFVSPWRPLIVFVPVAAVMIPLQYARFDAFSIYLVLLFSMFFAIGWVLHAQADLLPKMGGLAWIYIAIALAALPAMGVAHRIVSQAPVSAEPTLPLVVRGIMAAVVCSFMVFGILGLVVAHANRPSPLARYLADSSYWIYLVHLPVVLLIGAFLAVLPLPALVKWALTLAIAIPILFVSYHYLVRFTPIGTLLNGRRHRPARTAMVASRR